MFTLPGYKIIQELYENAWLKIYRGQRVHDQTPVLIKALQAGAGQADRARMMNEYVITRNLDSKGIIKPLRLEWAGLTFALILEDHGFIQLGKYFQHGSPALPDFFIVAMQLTETLGELHQHGITHRNLSLDSIFTDAAMSRVKIADFSMAALLSRKNQPEFTPHMTGAMAYLSPEQIGRTSKVLDHRSDFYSLGVIFYKLLTGRLPLQAGSHMQWVHAHMAKKPVAPEEINPDIPPAIAAIIMKLLAKSAGERYQSAAGLLADLAECRRQWMETGAIKPFLPGRMDRSGLFQLPRRLYGRQKEAAMLANVFAEVSAGRSGILLLHGYAGTGKTALVNEILRPISAKKGYFVTGKSDQLQWNIPYVPFIQAFGDLIRQILTESPDNLALWKKNLLQALGNSGAVVTKVIPAVELIIGAQPPVETLPLWETQNRFMMVFRRFIRVFAQPEHPLVIFLDDLQWADPATLGLIRYLGEDADCPYLLLVGAYRDNEVSGTHPLTVMLDKLKNGPVPVRQCTLPPLSQEYTNQFVADTLHCTREQSQPLARILHRKTGGNPFFLGQLLLSAHEENLLSFNAQAGRLEWNPEAISEMPLTDDVINFMLGKLQRLPEETLAVLKLAACIGNMFDLKILAFSARKTPGQAVADLWPAIVEGLVLITDADKTKKTYRIADNYPVVDIATKYEFLHDRVQQAAYSLLREAEKKAAHVKIGRLILQFTTEDLIEENVFIVMDHLNRGLDLITDQEERSRLAGYNLLAGRKAKAATAYDAALNYFKCGTELLPANAWADSYQLAFDLYLERAFCEYLCDRHDVARQLLATLLDKVKTDLERADICVAKILLYASRERYHETLEQGSEGLQMLGVNLPAEPGKIDLLQELLRVRWLLYKHEPGALAPPAAALEPSIRRVMRLLLTQAVAACMVKPDLFALIILKMSRFSFEQGDSELSPLGCACYSYFAGSVLQDRETSRAFAQIALRQVEQFEYSSTIRCAVYFVLGALVSHWTAPAGRGIAYLQKAVTYGLESGNLLIVSYALNLSIENKYLSGTPLDELHRECGRYHKLATSVRIGYYQALIEELRDPFSGERVAAASGKRSYGGPAETSPVGGEMPLLGEKDKDALKKGEINNITTYMILKMQVCYFRGNYGGALALAEEARANLSAVRGFLLSVDYIFFSSLAILAVLEDTPLRGQKTYRKMLTKNRRQLKRWAAGCPANFLHKYLLLSAEMARLEGRTGEAMTLYDEAIQAAQDNGYVQQEALAGELAGRFYAARGQCKVARVYLTDACHAYHRWGAMGRIRFLEEQYPQLLAGMMLPEEGQDNAEIIQDAVQVAGQADAPADLGLYAIRTAVHKMAAETDSQTLLYGFLEMAIEQAGADKGYLILEKDETLFVEAMKESDTSIQVPVPPVPLEKSTDLSRRVVRYVARTLEVAVVNDTEHIGVFARDPYLARRRTRSIVCLPLLCRDIPVGVLYLENTQMAGVFTPERVEMLQFLSSQIAYIQKLQSFLETDAGEVRAEKTVPPAVPLTERELEVLNLIAQGMSNKEIARVLFLTVNTVKTHVLKIYEKLQANRRVQAIARARELKLLADN